MPTLFQIKSSPDAPVNIIKRSAYKELMRTLNLRDMHRRFRVATTYLPNLVIKTLHLDPLELAPDNEIDLDAVYDINGERLS